MNNINENINKSRNTDYQILPLSENNIIDVYRTLAPQHFPASELKTLSAVKRLIEKGAYEGLGIYTAGEQGAALLGYALFMRPAGASTVLLDYYAILPEYRSLGLGSVFLSGIRKHYSCLAGILLETEDPDAAETPEDRVLRNRRNAFYMRNGARITSVRCTLFGVPFRILYLPTGQDLADSQVRFSIEETYRFMLPAEQYSKHLFWN